MVRGLECFSCEERLKVLFILEKERLQGIPYLGLTVYTRDLFSYKKNGKRLFTKALRGQQAMILN